MKHMIWTCLLVLGVVVCSGCGRFNVFKPKPRPGLLGPRAVVPPPYVTPAESTHGFAPTPVGTGVGFVDEDLPPPPEPGFEEMGSAEPGFAAPLTDDEASPPEPVVEDDGVVLPPDVDSEPLTYTVQRGDSLWKIGQMYGVTYQELAAYNNLDPKAVLPAGKVLRIPPGGRLIPESQRRQQVPTTETRAPQQTDAADMAVPPAPSGERVPIPADGKYTVVAGDSLWRISRRFGVKSADIMRWNDLDTDVLQIGQVLMLRGPGSSSAPPVQPRRLVEDVPAQAPVGVVEQPAPAPMQPAAGDGNAEGGQDDDDGTVGTTTVPEGPLAFPKTLDHTVAKGETLKIIAEMYGTTVEAILRANPGIKGDDDLRENLRILVPYR